MLLQLSRNSQDLTKEAIIGRLIGGAVGLGGRAAGAAAKGTLGTVGRAGRWAWGNKGKALAVGFGGLTAAGTVQNVGQQMAKSRSSMQRMHQAMSRGWRPAPAQQIFR